MASQLYGHLQVTWALIILLIIIVKVIVKGNNLNYCRSVKSVQVYDIQ